MAVDYRKGDMQLETTANQLPYQPTLFQCLGGQKNRQSGKFVGISPGKAC